MAQRQPARRFEDLIVCQKAHAFLIGVCQLTADVPREEMYGLTSQLRRAVSIPATVAECSKRRRRADQARLTTVAVRSREEARDYLRLARDPGYPADANLMNDAAAVGRLPGSYARTLLSLSS